MHIANDDYMLLFCLTKNIIAAGIWTFLWKSRVYITYC